MSSDLVTKEHVTAMQEYFFSRDFDPAGDVHPGQQNSTAVENEGPPDFANNQRRLQLRALVLLLARLQGAPQLKELLQLRHCDFKIIKQDMNDDDGGDIPPIGERGQAPHKVLTLRSGPDHNGKVVLFCACEHATPNECCVNAVGDLITYEEHAPSTQNQAAENVRRNWFHDSSDPSPFLFHQAADYYSPLNENGIRTTIELALAHVGAVPNVARIAESNVEMLVRQGISPSTARVRTLAPPVPVGLTPHQVRLRIARDFLESLKDIRTVMLQTSGWKLQRYEERWPLSSLDSIQSRDAKKFFRKVMRLVQDFKGCATCGATTTPDGKPLMKCTKCRTQLYCGRECQVQDWRRHKKEECKAILR